MRSLEDVLPNPIHPKLPDSAYEIIGGYKDAHAAKVAISTHRLLRQSQRYPRPRRLIKKRPPASKPPKPSPIQVALQHAKDMRSIEDVLPNPIHPKLPDSAFEIVGGYKDAHAAKVAISTHRLLRQSQRYPLPRRLIKK